MNPIEFAIPTGIDSIDTILGKVSQSSLFIIEPDDWLNSDDERKTYKILLNSPENQKPVNLGLIEFTEKNENLLHVKVTERYISKKKGLPDTGTPLMRFFCLLTQQLLSEGIATFDTQK